MPIHENNMSKKIFPNINFFPFLSVLLCLIIVINGIIFNPLSVHAEGVVADGIIDVLTTLTGGSGVAVSMDSPFYDAWCAYNGINNEEQAIQFINENCTIVNGDVTFNVKMKDSLEYALNQCKNTNCFYIYGINDASLPSDYCSTPEGNLACQALLDKYSSCFFVNGQSGYDYSRGVAYQQICLSPYDDVIAIGSNNDTSLCSFKLYRRLSLEQVRAYISFSVMSDGTISALNPSTNAWEDFYTLSDGFADWAYTDLTTAPLWQDYTYNPFRAYTNLSQNIIGDRSLLTNNTNGIKCFNSLDDVSYSVEPTKYTKYYNGSVPSSIDNSTYTEIKDSYNNTSGGSGGSGGSSDSGSGLGIFDAIGGAIGSILSGIFSILATIVEKLAEFFTTIIDTMLKTVDLFDNGFTEFLTALFPFFPEEWITLITLGLTFSVLAVVIRKFFG